MRIIGIILLLLMNISSSCGTPKEKLLVSGCGWNQVAILDKATGQIDWSHQLNEGEDCNDVEVTHEGNILYAYTRGARMITRSEEVIWDFKAKVGEELFTATQLPSGNYMLAICGTPSRIIELDTNGKQINELLFDTDISGVHDQFRQIVKTPVGTFLIPLMGKGEVIEMNKEKEIVNRVACGGNPFSIRILKNGNWLVACGDAHKFVEIDPESRQIIETVSSDDLLDYSLFFVAELIRFENGNTLICNWNGHTKDKTQPLLIEINSDKQVVWALPEHPGIVNISTVFSFKE